MNNPVFTWVFIGLLLLIGGAMIGSAVRQVIKQGSLDRGCLLPLVRGFGAGVIALSVASKALNNAGLQFLAPLVFFILAVAAFFLLPEPYFEQLSIFLSAPFLIAIFGTFCIALGIIWLVVNIKTDLVSGLVLCALLVLFGLFLLMIDLRILEKLAPDFFAHKSRSIRKHGRTER